MQVSFGFCWEAEVDHCRDIGDVQASCDHVSSYQIVHFAVLECFNRVQPIRLLHVTVDLGSTESIHGHQSHEPGALNLLIAEDYHPLFEASSEQ